MTAVKPVYPVGRTDTIELLGTAELFGGAVESQVKVSFLGGRRRNISLGHLNGLAVTNQWCSGSQLPECQTYPLERKLVRSCP